MLIFAYYVHDWCGCGTQMSLCLHNVGHIMGI